MTNEEKANELAVYLMSDGLREKNGINQRQSIEKVLLEMAEWKDKHPSVKMLEKTLELQKDFARYCFFKEGCKFTEEECFECKVNWYYDKLNEKK